MGIYQIFFNLDGDISTKIFYGKIFNYNIFDGYTSDYVLFLKNISYNRSLYTQLDNRHNFADH
jgi:hypothetical protein